MGESFDRLKNSLKKLPGLGAKSAERMAAHLCLESPQSARELVELLSDALEKITPCPKCMGLAESGEQCRICANPARDSSRICVVERNADIEAIERAGAWTGKYLVLGGKLSPLHKIGPEKLNLKLLSERIELDGVREILLALSNDIEGEATCHYIRERIVGAREIALTRIGFGLPNGSQLGFADSVTIKNALDSRRNF